MNTQAAILLEIDVARSNEQLLALSFVFAQSSEALRWEFVQRALEQTRAGKLSLDELIVARRAGRVVGAGWLQRMAGRVGMIWPAQLAKGEEPKIAAKILSRLDELAADRELRLLQAFVFANDEQSALRLSDVGYQSESELLIYSCEHERLARESSTEPLEYETYTQSQRARLERLVEQTYLQSLDCPELFGLHETSDIVEGHRAAGELDTTHWFFVRRDNQDVGCLLIADQPRDNQFELVYMGLVPTARGNGWGKRIACYAQWRARQAGRRKIILAVDSRNAPAIRMYEAAAFEKCNSRRVFLKIIGKL